MEFLITGVNRNTGEPMSLRITGVNSQSEAILRARDETDGLLAMDCVEEIDMTPAPIEPAPIPEVPKIKISPADFESDRAAILELLGMLCTAIAIIMTVVYFYGVTTGKIFPAAFGTPAVVVAIFALTLHVLSALDGIQQANIVTSKVLYAKWLAETEENG